MRALDRLLFEEYMPSRESLVLFRIGFAAYMLVLVFPVYQWIATFPDTFFAPPLGLTYFFFTGFPPAWFFGILETVLIVASVCLLCGRRVALASFVLSGALLVGNAWAFSFGKINHDILLILAPTLLALAGWDGRSTLRAWPLALFAWCIALALFTAAWQKVESGWLEPHTHAVLAHMLANIAMSGRETYAATLVMPWTPLLVWEAQDVATIVLEGSFVLAWLRRSAFRVACAFACLFHLAVALLMQIMFGTNLIAYAAFVDWEHVTMRMPLGTVWRRAPAWLAARTTAQVLVAGFGLSALYLTAGNPLVILTESLRLHPETMHVHHVMVGLFGAGVAVVYLARVAGRRLDALVIRSR